MLWILGRTFDTRASLKFIDSILANIVLRTFFHPFYSTDPFVDLSYHIVDDMIQMTNKQYCAEVLGWCIYLLFVLLSVFKANAETNSSLDF